MRWPQRTGWGLCAKGEQGKCVNWPRNLRKTIPGSLNLDLGSSDYVTWNCKVQQTRRLEDRLALPEAHMMRVTDHAQETQLLQIGTTAQLFVILPNFEVAYRGQPRTTGIE